MIPGNGGARARRCGRPWFARHLPISRGTVRAMRLALAALLLATATTAAVAAPTPHEFLDDAKALLVVGACADGAPPAGVKQEILDAHCKTVRATQEDYKKSWLHDATEFFAAHVPTTIPKTVVYPFAGGDLSTALTVYPDADEITTLSLEPAGDPHALGRLGDKELKTALATVEKELGSLYRSNFSVTMNMIGAMRSGALPTNLIFSLSALWIHGYEPTAMRYFKLTDAGEIVYLTDDDVAKMDADKDASKRNRDYADVEIRFHKTGTKHEQVYRHIMANLDDAHVKSSPGALAHLVAKGDVAGMTKAASYLLTFDDFTQMRKYVIDHVKWMVSDSTGLAPTYGTPAGFEYETYGEFGSSNMAAGKSIAPKWKALFAAQPKRELKFRFGYPDGKYHGHLIIMKRPDKT